MGIKNFNLLRLIYNVLAPLLVIISLMGLTACNGPSVGYNKGYSPEQPIPYDHSLHAGTYKIPCQYCHVQTERAKQASVPSLNICMNCHIMIKTSSPHIKKIQKAYTEGGSVAWKRVHLLPDHVHFNHKRHIKKGVACTTCHGDVEKMKVLYQYSDLSMGWCVNCHRQPENKAPLNCSTCHY